MFAFMFLNLSSFNNFLQIIFLFVSLFSPLVLLLFNDRIINNVPSFSEVVHFPSFLFSSVFILYKVCPESIQPCTMKNIDIY